jgi:hypothetical protein
MEDDFDLLMLLAKPLLILNLGKLCLVDVSLIVK